MDLITLWKCINGPRLFRLYETHGLPSKNYSPSSLEALLDNIINFFAFMWDITIYSSPITLCYFYRKGYLTTLSNSPKDSNLFLYRSSALVFMFGIGTAMFIRGICRYNNKDYINFISTLNKIYQSRDNERMINSEIINKYDFDFRSWPVVFRWIETKLGDKKKIPTPLDLDVKSNTTEKIKNFPISVISYLIIKLVGRRMLYPGSNGILQKMMEPLLNNGRIRLIEHYHGKRNKIETLDGNYIDTMFIDNRNLKNNGNKLVICCEGNAGFYEIGITTTPIAAGYSTLGWNHPGFGGSSGTPYPSQEINAIDTVMKFAIEKLKFDQKDIIIFAWSIGGYPASWAAMHYPNIKGLILDATFDNVVKLAVTKMPSYCHLIVDHAISNYFNLNVSEQLKHYNGPILIIRRTKDEIINTNEDEPIKTNRANNILINLFRTRFPNLMAKPVVEEALINWLNKERYSAFKISSSNALTVLYSYLEKNEHSYPIEIGDELIDTVSINLILYLASITLKDYDATHCTALPVENFTEPIDIFDLFNKSMSKL